MEYCCKYKLPTETITVKVFSWGFIIYVDPCYKLLPPVSQYWSLFLSTKKSDLLSCFVLSIKGVIEPEITRDKPNVFINFIIFYFT